MDELIKKLVEYGILGIVVACLIVYVNSLQKNIDNITKRLFLIIENNTKAMTELRKIIEGCKRDCK
jgi:hypothetical protein